MSNHREAWEFDCEWLREQLQKINQVPGDNFEDKFCDVVTRFVQDGWSVKEAQKKALRICLL